MVQPLEAQLNSWVERCFAGTLWQAMRKTGAPGACFHWLITNHQQQSIQYPSFDDFFPNYSGWQFQPLWKICLSNNQSFVNTEETKKCLKPKATNQYCSISTFYFWFIRILIVGWISLWIEENRITKGTANPPWKHPLDRWVFPNRVMTHGSG